MQVKICVKCKQEKPHNSFTKSIRNKDVLSSYCMPCKTRYDKQYYVKNKEKIDKRNFQYSQKHKDETRKTKRKYDRSDKGKAKRKKYYFLHKKEFNNSAIKSRIKLTAKVIKKYGSKCACCGENNTDLLTIDHIYGGGTREIKNKFNGRQENFYRYLRDNPVSSQYQILCWNCNCGKRNNHVCPHNKKEWDKVIKEKQTNQCSRHLLKLKAFVIDKLGGVCVYPGCQERNSYFLSLDHIDNNGAAERKKIKSTTLYRLIRDDKIDISKYQILCYNHNWLKEKNRRKSCIHDKSCPPGRHTYSQHDPSC